MKWCQADDVPRGDRQPGSRAPPVHRDRHKARGIHVDNRISWLHRGKGGPEQGRGHRLAHSDLDIPARDDARRDERARGRGQLDVAEGVHREDLDLDLGGGGRGGGGRGGGGRADKPQHRRGEPHEPGRVHRRTEPGQAVAGREGRGGGREHIPPVECRRCLGGNRQRDRGTHTPERLGRRRQQPVVGTDKKSPRGGHRERPPRGSHPRVDNREVHRAWQVADCLGEHDRSPPQVTDRYQMGDVNNAHARRPAQQHPMAGSHETVNQAVVRQKADIRRPDHTTPFVRSRAISRAG